MASAGGAGGGEEEARKRQKREREDFENVQGGGRLRVASVGGV